MCIYQGDSTFIRALQLRLVSRAFTVPRGPRNAPGGIIYHVLNRANEKATLFSHLNDYQAFVDVVNETLLVAPMRILSYCLMPNHWHFIFWPELDDQLSEFMHQLTTTHAQRWRAFRRSTGNGHVYQGPFKSFPMKDDRHFFTATRYVERNAKRANLVVRAEDWFWCSASNFGSSILPISGWPIPKPTAWLDWVNQPLSDAELKAIRSCVRRGTPYGSESWKIETAKRLGLESTLRPRGRPRGSLS